jgi:hypothetical protein
MDEIQPPAPNPEVLSETTAAPTPTFRSGWLGKAGFIFALLPFVGYGLMAIIQPG